MKRSSAPGIREIEPRAAAWNSPHLVRNGITMTMMIVASPDIIAINITSQPKLRGDCFDAKETLSRQRSISAFWTIRTVTDSSA